MLKSNKYLHVHIILNTVSVLCAHNLLNTNGIRYTVIRWVLNKKSESEKLNFCYAIQEDINNAKPNRIVFTLSYQH